MTTFRSQFLPTFSIDLLNTSSITIQDSSCSVRFSNLLSSLSGSSSHWRSPALGGCTMGLRNNSYIIKLQRELQAYFIYCDFIFMKVCQCPLGQLVLIFILQQTGARLQKYKFFRHSDLNTVMGLELQIFQRNR